MNRLYVLYDARCGLCSQVRQWCEQQRQFVPLEFIPAGSRRAAAMFPELRTAGGEVKELLAVDDRGGVYHEDEAWLMVLWALEEYRPWAERLSTPGLRSLGRQAFVMLSENRRALSGLLGYTNDAELQAWLNERRMYICS